MGRLPKCKSWPRVWSSRRDDSRPGLAMKSSPAAARILRSGILPACGALLFGASIYSSCQPRAGSPVARTTTTEREQGDVGPARRTDRTEASAAVYPAEHDGARQETDPEDPNAPLTSHGGPSAEPVHATAPASETAPSLPSELTLSKPVEVAMDRDRSVRIAHAGPDTNAAIVYLHGMCGNPKGADPWLDIATKRGTFIVVRANVPCPDRPGYKWPKDPQLIQARIETALKVAKEQRGGHLDTRRVTLIGYSQGSHRAELLAARYPGRYPLLVLGGPPTAAEPQNFASVHRVAILGGELEDTSHMLEGLEALKSSEISARFFLLPGAHHGNYGAQGRRIMTEVFEWLHDGVL